MLAGLRSDSCRDKALPGDGALVFVLSDSGCVQQDLLPQIKTH